MVVCYIDESGCTGVLPSYDSDVQPVFVLAGFCIDSGKLRELTDRFLKLKNRFGYTNQEAEHYLDSILHEIKGSRLRKEFISVSHRRRSRAIGFLDNCIGLLRRHSCRILGRVLVKQPGFPIDSQAIYTAGIQSLCIHFNEYLSHMGDSGIMILDSRHKPQNTNVFHSVFTGKFRAAGDRFSQIIDMPLFGHSDNHAGIQLADILCSAMIFPMAIRGFCTEDIKGVHCQDYSSLTNRYGHILQEMQFRYKTPEDKLTGGITVSDKLNGRHGGHLFKIY